MKNIEIPIGGAFYIDGEEYKIQKGKRGSCEGCIFYQVECIKEVSQLACSKRDRKHDNTDIIITKTK